MRATRGSYCLTSAALSTSGEGSPPAAPLPCSATPPMAFFSPSKRPIAASPRVRRPPVLGSTDAAVVCRVRVHGVGLGGGGVGMEARRDDGFWEGQRKKRAIYQRRPAGQSSATQHQHQDRGTAWAQEMPRTRHTPFCCCAPAPSHRDEEEEDGAKKAVVTHSCCSSSAVATTEAEAALRMSCARLVNVFFFVWVNASCRQRGGTSMLTWISRPADDGRCASRHMHSRRACFHNH